MNRLPDMETLEGMLRSSTLVAGGFLGTDRRPIQEIVEADAAALARAGWSPAEVVARMREITALALSRLGSWAHVGEDLDAAATDTRGVLPCPWPHPGHYGKTVITVRNPRTGGELRWSGLNVHMIEAHTFFEGKGARFRLEPTDLVSMLFPAARRIR